MGVRVPSSAPKNKSDNNHSYFLYYDYTKGLEGGGDCGSKQVYLKLDSTCAVNRGASQKNKSGISHSYFLHSAMLNQIMYNASYF